MLRNRGNVVFLKSDRRTTCLLLDTEGAEGCRTQVRHEHLGRDRYHIAPQHGWVMDVQYGCAIVGLRVPCPY